MKKNIATLLRRAAQWLDPQKQEVTGYARKVVDFIPYCGIDIYRALLLGGSEDQARNLKASMRALAESVVESRLNERLFSCNTVRLEHNFGTQEKDVDGIKCRPEGVTVIVELKGSWR